MRESRIMISLPVASDLSGGFGKFVKTSATGLALVASAGGAALGVLESTDGDTLGKAVPVTIFGVTKVLAGGTVAVNAQVQSDASGDAITASTADYVLGTCLEGGDDGDMITILFNPQGQNNAA